MEKLIEAATELLEGNWTKFVTALLMMAVGWFFGRRKAKSDWRRKEFYDRLNVSLNSITSGTLQIRTVLEKSCQEIFLNVVATEKVIECAKQTTANDPTLPLPKDDYWYYLNSVLNEVAEKFAEGTLHRDMGQPVRAERYAISLTSESAGDLRTRKVRAMLVQTKLLDNLPTEPPKFESPHHTTRWETLKQLARERKANPHKFLELEICVPAS
jgi:hypothetical protein